MTFDLSVEMLPAGHGDALWLEWGPEPDRHRMLIDGGTRGTYTTLESRLERLGERPRVDLMVVTHIDADHIDGAIKLLGNTDLGVEYGDVWFNGWPHLQPPDSGPTRGGRQGSVLEAVIERRARPWNRAFDGGAVVVDSSGPLPAVRLAGGMRLTLLSPTWTKLEELRPEWKKALDEAEMDPDDRTEALEYAESRYGVTRGRTDFGADHSEANGSSIAFIAEYANERWLFAGDAHVDVLLSALLRFGAERDERPVRLDGFKVPHHGSVKNIRADLLDAVDCRRFLVSTNGAYFKHPDKACLDLIIGHSDQPELVFNYETDFNRDWAEDGDDYTSRYDEVVQLGVPGAPPAADREREEIDSGDGGDGPAPSPLLSDRADGEQSSDGDGPPITFTVHHGSLDRADHPVLVGHYAGTPLAGAAGSADRRLEGRIAGRLAAGAFSGAWSTSARVVAPESSVMAEGAIVVGLGEYSQLTRMRLAETVRRALLDHALAEADRADVDAPLALKVSSVLLGATGDQGLSVRASVHAMVAAVLAVNRDLRRADEADLAKEDRRVRARYETLQIFERGPAEAELAYLAVCGLATGGPGDKPKVTHPGDLRLAAGRLVNDLPYDASQGVWWRMRVDDVSQTPEGDLHLEYSVAGGLARAGRVRHPVERRGLMRRLRQHAARRRPPDALHTVLYELLLPNSIKADLMAAQDIHLEVTAATADIPWEMLAASGPAGTRSPLALRAPFVRQLGLSEMRDTKRSDRTTALVIGNPPTDGGYDPLPGAAAEAAQVRDLLEDDYRVADFVFEPDDPVPDDLALRLEEAVVNGGYRIMHIAGHGEFQPDDPGRTGVVIGRDQFLSADMFMAMRDVPDVVFLNCCHLATVTPDRESVARPGRESGVEDYTRQRFPQLAASLSMTLIGAGVRVVVAAGWAVEDVAATAFARVFYTQMLAGVPFGDAVFAARKAAAEEGHGPSSTWGAYQCYGDGGFRLPPSGFGGSDSSDDARAATPTHTSRAPRTVYEAYRELEKSADRAETASPTEFVDLRPELERHIETVEGHARGVGWFAGQGGRLWEVLARTWQAVGVLERAISCYEEGLASEKATMSLAGVEQLANLCDRRAAVLLDDESVSEADREEADRLIARSAALLDHLDSLHPSGERLALSASNLKRRAALVHEEERLPILEAAASGYLDSYRAEPQPYTLFNFLQVAKLCALAGSEPTDYASLVAHLPSEVEAIEGKQVSTRSFWDLVALPDAELTMAIVDGTVADRRDDLERMYRRALRRGLGSERESTIDHIRDLARLHTDPDEAAALMELRRRLRWPIGSTED